MVQLHHCLNISSIEHVIDRLQTWSRCHAGKSFLVLRIIKDLEAQGLHVAVTAVTGTAAEQLHGTTLHRFLGGT